VASETPRNLVERAAEAAFTVIEGILSAEGAGMESMLITLHANNVPAGELNAVSAAFGDSLPDELDERARQVVAMLVDSARAVGEQIGVHIAIHPIGRG
jgi:hypothetical protein